MPYYVYTYLKAVNFQQRFYHPSIFRVKCEGQLGFLFKN